MVRPFLVCYDYGMGGIWKCLRADSADEILNRYPELAIAYEKPQWMSAGDFAKEQRDAIGLDDTDDLFLRAVVSDRGKAAFGPDARLRFRILSAEEGGHQGKGFSGKGGYFGCPLLAPDGTYWDCRVIYDHQDLQADVEYEFDIFFLSPNEAPTHLPAGSAVTLGTPGWVIGPGTVRPPRGHKT